MVVGTVKEITIIVLHYKPFHLASGVVSFYQPNLINVYFFNLLSQQSFLSSFVRQFF